MVREKIQRVPEYREVVYSKDRWRLLNMLRKEAINILKPFYMHGIRAVVHGSIARGDVWKGSDIDVFIPYHVPSYKIEVILENSGYKINYKYIVMATPLSSPKAYIVLDNEEKRVISFPLVKLQQREIEFYRFGGLVDLDMLYKNVRVPGVDKRLILIKPTKTGHVEMPVIGYEEEVAKLLGISVDTVLERVRVLSRRDEVGRTGVFLKYILSPEEVFEEVLQDIAAKNPWVRRVLKERGF